MHNGTWLNGHQYRKSVAVIEIKMAALKRCSKYGVSPLELELSDCTKEVTVTTIYTRTARVHLHLNHSRAPVHMPCMTKVAFMCGVACVPLTAGCSWLVQ